MAKKRTGRQRSNQNAQKNSRQNGNVKTRNYVKSTDTPVGSPEIKQNDSKDVNLPSKTLESLMLCPPKGLVNLGNTCFFNSVMQNLCRTPGLLYSLQKANKEKQLVVRCGDIQSLYCELGPMDKLSQTLLNFLTMMNEDTSSLNFGGNNQKQTKRSKTESPRVLFNQICNASPRFRGYQQQDSQELLQALLDGIKSEEIKRRKRAILSSLGILRKNAKDVDSDLRDRIKSYGQAVIKMPTVIDEVFGGKIVSSVLCDECGQITQVLEDFLDIPLPIVEAVQAHHVGDAKKYKKEAESDCSVDKSKSEDTTISKHLSKKKKQQGRKNNRRQRTKSQTVASDVKNKDASVEENGIDSLANQLESLKVEPLKGTDFSTNKVTIINESDLTVQTDQEIIEKSRNIVDLAIKAALNEATCENSDGISQESPTLNINGCCKGGSNTAGPAHSAESKDDVVHDEKNTLHSECQTDVNCKSNNPIILSVNGLEGSAGDASVHNTNNSNNLDEKEIMNDKKSIKCSDSEPSSGNDEKEESMDDTTKTIPQDAASFFDTPAKKTEIKFTNFCAKFPTSLSPRYEPKNQECSIQSCLHKFTMAEMLTGQNKYGCEECTRRQTKGQEKPKTVYCNASKQMLIKVPPLILTLQLKRFQQTGRSLRKLGRRVDIPVELDISPFCTEDENSEHFDCDGQIRYRIYGIVEHSGSLSRGHYTAYVNVHPECTDVLKHLGKEVSTSNGTEDPQNFSQWYHISDTAVSKTTLDRALNSNAYLVFYERVF